MAHSKREKTAALIIAGGRGTRFWPEGRANRPKPLFAPDGKTSLLEATIARALPLFPREQIYVEVARDHAVAFRSALKSVLPPENLIIEPEARGTTVAITYGTAVIQQRLSGEPVVAVMPADHYIREAGRFRTTLTRAIRLARRSEAIVMVGITPTRAETGYGYQEIGEPLGNGYRIAGFVEKPSLSRARSMVHLGRFLWNAGIFVMTSCALKSELQSHVPELAKLMPRLSSMKPSELRSAYRMLDVGSFDRAVAEKSRNLIGVQAQFDWDDVGSWEGLWEALSGGRENVEMGRVIALESRSILARSGKRLMVLLGVKNLIAVDTDDAILITSRAHAQNLSRVIDELKRRKLDQYL
jgi:mannose-1-phosphate guanylyltransferase